MLNQIQTLAKVLRASNLTARVWSKYGMNRIYIKGVCGVVKSSKLYIDFPEFDNDDWDGTIEGCSRLLCNHGKEERTVGLTKQVNKSTN